MRFDFRKPLIKSSYKLNTYSGLFLINVLAASLALSSKPTVRSKESILSSSLPKLLLDLRSKCLLISNDCSFSSSVVPKFNDVVGFSGLRPNFLAKSLLLVIQFCNSWFASAILSLATLLLSEITLPWGLVIIGIDSLVLIIFSYDFILSWICLSSSNEDCSFCFSGVNGASSFNLAAHESNTDLSTWTEARSASVFVNWFTDDWISCTLASWYCQSWYDCPSCLIAIFSSSEPVRSSSLLTLAVASSKIPFAFSAFSLNFSNSLCCVANWFWILLIAWLLSTKFARICWIALACWFWFLELLAIVSNTFI